MAGDSRVLILPVVGLALVLAAPLRANDVPSHAVPNGYVQAKLQYCTDCHGPSGRGYRGYYTMPRLAGQTADYFENQLRAFIAGRRDGHLPLRMARVHGISPGLQTALAARFGKLEPAPFGGGPRSQVATGRAIYQDGVPESNIPACAACHGPSGQGAGQNARLAGQLYAYTVGQLRNWNRDRGADTATTDPAGIMRLVAQNLSPSQASAVAAYVNTLR